MLLLTAAVLAGCDAGDAGSTGSSFCRTWLELTSSDREVELDRQVREWVLTAERARSSSAQFLACVAERTRAESYRITRACQSTLRGVKAPVELGRVVVRAGQLCAGVDMY